MVQLKQVLLSIDECQKRNPQTTFTDESVNPPKSRTVKYNFTTNSMLCAASKWRASAAAACLQCFFQTASQLPLPAWVPQRAKAPMESLAGATAAALCLWPGPTPLRIVRLAWLAGAPSTAKRRSVSRSFAAVSGRVCKNSVPMSCDVASVARRLTFLP